MHTGSLRAAPGFGLLFAVIASLVWASPRVASAAEGDAPAYEAVTAANPSVEVDRLKIMVRPLTQEKLAAEADAWMGLVEAKAQAIANAKLGVKAAIERARDVEAGEDLSGIGDASDAVADAAEDAVAEVEAEKTQSVEGAVALQAELTSLVDRADVVLDAYEAKGGDAEAHRTYLSSVSGSLDIDVQDAGAAAAAVRGWIESPEGGVRWGTNLVKFVVTLILAFIVAGLAGRITAKAVSKNQKLSSLMREFLASTVRKIVLIIGFVVALSMLEVNIGPLVAAIGAIGFIVAFALQGTLSNFASGLLILFYRPFDTGDVVNAGGVTGKVESMNLMTTHITTPDNQQIVVPNNSIWGSVITNITGKPTRRVDLVFGVSYTDDLAKVETILREVAEAHPLTHAEPAVNIKMHELGDSSVNFICRPWTNTDDYWDVYWDLQRQVKERFDAEGISIPFPQRDVHIINEKNG